MSKTLAHGASVVWARKVEERLEAKLAMDGCPDGTMLRGKLLVAAPGLLDPNFFRTVVLLVEHNDEGAAGVVLNRPSETGLSDGPLSDWAVLAADPALVFVGGPVQPTAAVCLARAGPDGSPDGWQQIIGPLGVIDMGRELSDVRALDRVRVFAGYAGWGPGQLEREIEEGAWYVLDADPNDALSSEPGGLWRFVLRRQGGKLSLVANFPADPNMN
jgi:putative transcriptional regulator